MVTIISGIPCQKIYYQLATIVEFYIGTIFKYLIYLTTFIFIFCKGNFHK